jgi:hypothetical protein
MTRTTTSVGAGPSALAVPGCSRSCLIASSFGQNRSSVTVTALPSRSSPSRTLIEDTARRVDSDHSVGGRSCSAPAGVDANTSQISEKATASSSRTMRGASAVLTSRAARTDRLACGADQCLYARQRFQFGTELRGRRGSIAGGDGGLTLRLSSGARFGEDRFPVPSALRVPRTAARPRVARSCSR